MATIKVCKVDELAPGSARRVAVEPEPIALFRLEDGFYATSDTCTHAQSSLAAGDVDLEDCSVECPYHGAVFDIRSGRAMGLPATKPVRTYTVTVIDGEVFIETE
ncbi:bifunctional 3-phenylpropionate/cinnamic acid dioxygenase ferredoxin subunit [bacterium]|nr:bifunctional 3-phenylpropionate/cinnamic acid dioxygenase ferredoxin subunit [bacterium]